MQMRHYLIKYAHFAYISRTEILVFTEGILDLSENTANKQKINVSY